MNEEAGGTTGANPETVRRAEEVVDRMGEQIGSFTSRIGQELRKLGARAREEVEDMWAEAQSIRRREEA